MTDHYGHVDAVLRSNVFMNKAPGSTVIAHSVSGTQAVLAWSAHSNDPDRLDDAWVDGAVQLADGGTKVVLVRLARSVPNPRQRSKLNGHQIPIVSVASRFLTEAQGADLSTSLLEEITKALKQYAQALQRTGDIYKRPTSKASREKLQKALRQSSTKRPLTTQERAEIRDYLVSAEVKRA